jgi:hypothetical protein
MKIKNKNAIIAIVVAVLLVLIIIIAGRYIFLSKKKKELSESATITSQENSNQLPVSEFKGGDKNRGNDNQIDSAIRMTAHRGEIFSAKVPDGWKVDENISGINIWNPSDENIAAFLIAVPQAPGRSSPDAFLNTVIGWEGLSDVNLVSQSEERKTTIPQSPPLSDFVWKEKSRTFTCTKESNPLKIKSVAGVVNIYGYFSATVQGFKTPLDEWGKWAPLLERIASSIIITNPLKVGGKDKVILPSAKNLANDSSPIMEVWNYRNQVEDRASHEFSDAILGVETDLVSPSTGRTYRMPLSSYDPTKGGYHNPDNYSEILEDFYK